eukprot:366012-Chlamydomonas_euryale.AAC.3
MHDWERIGKGRKTGPMRPCLGRMAALTMRRSLRRGMSGLTLSDPFGRQRLSRPELKHHTHHAAMVMSHSNAI